MKIDIYNRADSYRAVGYWLLRTLDHCSCKCEMESPENLTFANEHDSFGQLVSCSLEKQNLSILIALGRVVSCSLCQFGFQFFKKNGHHELFLS